jgi:stress-induced morphogen
MNEDREVAAIHEALGPYRASHPQARVDVRRRSMWSIRVRIIDPAFRGLSRVEREPLVYEFLDQLPEDVSECITMVLLLAPDEVEDSLVNMDFENPLPLTVL